MPIFPPIDFYTYPQNLAVKSILNPGTQQFPSITIAILFFSILLAVMIFIILVAIYINRKYDD